MKKYDGIKGGGDLQQTNSLLQRVYMYIYIYMKEEKKKLKQFFILISQIFFSKD